MYEFTYDIFSPVQRDAYLQRINWTGPLPLTRDTLDRLVYLHQLSVPFEDLDIYPIPKRPITLDPDDLFHKVVELRRGGFCFELNGAFLLLLRAIGFDAYGCMCRVAATRDFLGDLAHRATLVRLDGHLYLCDVGLGGPMAPFAVEVSPERQTRMGETYWVEPTEEGWYLQRRLDEAGNPAQVIIFAPIPFLPKDFKPLCQALINNPESSFRCHRTVNLRTVDGHLNLRDSLLTIRDQNGKREQAVTEEELPQLLKELFHLTNF